LATGAALKWAESPERWEYARGAQYVYNDHVDVDGFLAAWVCTNPDEALAEREALLAAAAAGDFLEWTGEPAMKFALLGEWLDDPETSPLAREAFGIPERARDEALYQAVLREMPHLLHHPGDFEELWRRPYEDLMAQVRLFEGGRARVEEFGPLHLSVIHTPRVLRTRAVLARARGDRLLQVVQAQGGYMYVFRYRPLLGYRIVSRPLTPIHDPEDLAEALNALWPTVGEAWRTRAPWSRDLMLFARSGGRRSVPRTPPEVVLPIFEGLLRGMDLRYPGARADL
jgi:hypothetical protein